MKKYKLIKTYPGSPCFGTEIIEAADIRGRYFIKRSDIWFINNPEKYPEYWEEVVEKDYEILSFISTDKAIGEKPNVIRYISKDQYSIEDYLYKGDSVRSGAYLIHSVKRLSDSEIFTIGDKIDWENISKSVVITKIELNREQIVVFAKYHSNMEGSLPLKVITKIKQPLFTTEDGVDIYEGDDFWILDILNFTVPVEAVGRSFNNYKDKYLDFSTKEKAEKYVLMNKKSLSPNDILKVWSKLSGHSVESLLKNSKLMHRIITSIK